MCLGFEPGAAGWWAQTKPRSYGGHPSKSSLLEKDGIVRTKSKLSGSVCTYYSAVPGLNPKHNNYVYQFKSELQCEKDENKQKEAGFAHTFFQKRTK